MASDATLSQRLAEIVSGHRLLDLSVTLDEALPCWWPSHVPFQHKTYTGSGHGRSRPRRRHRPLIGDRHIRRIETEPQGGGR